LNNKNLFNIFMVFLLFFGLIGCSVKNNYDMAPGDGGNDDTERNAETVNHSERKIIYTASAKIITKDLDATLNGIHGFLNDDEWFDKESHSDNQSYLVIRVKTTRLEQFINILSDYGKVKNLNKEAIDISLQYQNTANKISSLEAERARLVELYESASMSDMILINARITEIDLQLGELDGTLIEFDSLIEYSTVTLTVTEDYSVSKIPYGKRLINAFTSGFRAVRVFFEYLLIVFSTLLPFLLVLSPVGIIIGVIYHKNKKKKKE